MAGAQAGTRLGRLGMKARGGAGIEDLRGLILAAVADRVEIGDAFGVKLDLEVGAGAGDETGLQRAAFGAPFGTATLEDLYRLGAECVERPPDPGGGEEALFVIEDDGVVL